MTLLFLTSTIYCKEKEIKIGYLVCFYRTDVTNAKTNVKEVQKLETAINIMELYYPDIRCFDVKAELRLSRYFEIMTETKSLYIEVKQINKQGKYRKITKKQFKSLRR